MFTTTTPRFEKFADFLAYIEDSFIFTPGAFDNNGIHNHADENLGAQKVFAYAHMKKLSSRDTLQLFCEHYKAVMDNPKGKDHRNIREFMRGGWGGVSGEFMTSGNTLIGKEAALNPDLEKIAFADSGEYLFTKIANKRKAFTTANPNAKLISFGIGDISQPLGKSVVAAAREASVELEDKVFGYGDTEGYDWLRQMIADKINGFANGGLGIDKSEVFVSSGAKEDTSNFGANMFRPKKIAVADPAYPVYINAHAQMGQLGKQDAKTGAWENVVYLPMTKENGFVPELPKQRPDLIYLCSPNNPTGAAMTRDQLQVWVDYALENHSVILFDAAYEAYIADENIPHSIYEIPGANQCAVEFGSFSKTHGFTGIRLGWTIVPHELLVGGRALGKMWQTWQNSHFNGAGYVNQKMGAAALSPKGVKEAESTISIYRGNAEMILRTLQDANIYSIGGTNAPYIWFEVPQLPGTKKGEKPDGWEFLDLLLEKAHMVCTPGKGFGPSGDGWCRFTSFASPRNTIEGCARLEEFLLNLRVKTRSK
ncbi:MAG: LL-diaminopimelate aminotransferase [Rickettsiales bacterium]|jgi:LL-diaminopimelate aminotransferase|nr:LL-diaminopimelate aminotransferase [Rickettsiales bacterium]